MCKTQGLICDAQGTWYKVQHKVYGTRYMTQKCTGYSSVHDIWYIVHGTWYIVNGTLCLMFNIHCARYEVQGTMCNVQGTRFNL